MTSWDFPYFCGWKEYNLPKEMIGICLSAGLKTGWNRFGVVIVGMMGGCFIQMMSC